MELAAALAVVGVEGVIAEPPVDMSTGDDLDAAEDRLTALVDTEARRLGASLILSPHPGDGHHAHAVVGRAVARGTAGELWWAWGVWRDVASPNRYVPYGQEVLDRLVQALRCHAGELARNDYEDLLRSRARLQAVVGSERVLGFGSGPAAVEPYADLFEERLRDPGSGSGWHLSGRHVVGLGQLLYPHPDGRQRGVDALVDGVGDGPQ